MGEIGDALRRLEKKSCCKSCRRRDEWGGAGLCFECYSAKQNAAQAKGRKITGSSNNPSDFWSDSMAIKHSYTGRYYRFT